MEEDTNFSEPTNLSTTSSTEEPVLHQRMVSDATDEEENLQSQPKTTESNEQLPDWPTTPFNNYNEEIYAQLELLQQEIKKKDDKIDELQEHITTLETVHLQSKKKRRLSNDELEQQVSNSKDEEILRLQNEVQKLKEKLGEPVDQADTGTQIDEENNHNKPMNTDIVKLIEEKLNTGLNAIKINVNQLIENKLNTIIEPNTNETNSNKIQNYANVVGKNQNSVTSDFRTIMMANRNEELAEETEKKRRSNNLIIHGKDESAEGDDKVFVENLIKELETSSVVIKQIDRIGQQSDNKNRPIKVTLKNEEERDKILDNLRNLKGKSLYKGVSVTPDYTQHERMLVKEFYEKAKLKTVEEESNETNYIWRVRGTPKNGLSLKRLSKVNQTK